MSASKQLRFEFVLDLQSFQQVKRALGELTTEAQKFAKAMQGSGGGLFGGANVGSRNPSQAQTHGKMHAAGIAPVGPISSNLAQAVLRDVSALKSLSKSGADAMKIMKDATGQSIREQIAIVENLDKKIASLQNRYASLKGPDAKSRAAQNLLALGNKRNDAASDLNALSNLHHGPSFGGAIAGGFAQGGIRGAAMEGMSALGIGGMSAGMATAATVAAVGAAVAAAVYKAVDKATATSVQFDEKQMNLYAAQGRAMDPFVTMGKRADPKILNAMSSLKNGAFGDKENTIKAFRSVFGSDKDISRVLGGVSDTVWNNWSGEKLTAMAMKNAQGEDLVRLADAASQTVGHKTRIGWAQEWADETRAERLAASQMAGRGWRVNPETRQLEDSFTGWKANLHRRGFTTSQALSGMLASQHGAGSGQFGGDIMSSTAAGWGQYGNVLTAAARMAGTSGARGLATLGLGGGISRGAGMQLAQGVLGSGFDPRGTTGMAGVLGAFQGGYGHMLGKNADPALQYNAANQYLAAMQTGSAFTTGASSPFQLGMNVLGAVGAMPGCSMYHQDLLAQRFDMKQMMAGASGTLTGTMADVARLTGMSQDTFQKQIGNSFDGSLAMWADTGANDAVSLAMRKYRASGKSVKDFAKTASTDELKALGIGLSEVSGQDLEGSIGSMFALKGLGHKGAGGAAPMAGRPDDETKAKLEAEAKKMEEAQKVLETHFDTLLANLKAATDLNPQMAQDISMIRAVLVKAAGLMGIDVTKIEESLIKNVILGLLPKPANFTDNTPAGRATAKALGK